MAINNVYNQTPKRIYSNKPFVKGMNYTNADMGEYVCRSVANLDLESSNTATKLRAGTKNSLKYEGKMLKFYSKLLLFDNVVLEEDYINNKISMLNGGLTHTLGLNLIDEESKNVSDFYEYIIKTNTDIVWNGTDLDTPDNFLITTSGSTIAVMIHDDGTVPHVINSNDYSIAFFGMVINNGTIVYKGLIKIYFHATLKKAIIEVVNPSIVNPIDVNTYGSNLVQANPLLFKDYVYFRSTAKDYYSQYGMVSEAANKNITDISTVMIYDKPVIYNSNMEIISGDNANVVKGVDKTINNTMYVRPYCVVPKGDYGLSVSVNTDSGDMYYNISTNTFEYPDVSDEAKKDITLDEYISSTIRYVQNYEIVDPMQHEAGVDSDYSSFVLNELANQPKFKFSLVDNLTAYSIISDNNIILTDDSITFIMRKFSIYAEPTVININDLRAYDRLNPYIIPLNIKVTGKRSLGIIMSDPLFFKDYAVYDRNKEGLGEFLRNNYDAFVNGIAEYYTNEQPSKTTDFVEGEIQMYMAYGKIYYRFVIRPVLDADGNIADDNMVRFANEFGTPEEGTTDLASVYDMLISDDHPIRGILDAVSFQPSLLRYDPANIFQVDSNGTPRECFYGLTMKVKLTANEVLSVLSNQYVQTFNIDDTTEPLNFAIKTTAFNNKVLVNNSVSLKVHLIHVYDTTTEYTYYLENSKVTANTSYINTYKYEVLKYNSIRENNNPLDATNVMMHLGHYVLYGNKTGSNALYYSFFQDIAYFPSMYVIEFSSPIVHIHPHQSNLVVFTEDDIHLVYNGSVPATTTQDGSEVPFTVKLIQSNVRLGKDNINTVRSIGKDVFFITNTNIGYLLKSNKYVNEASDTYLVNITNAIGDLLKNPYGYALERYKCYFPEYELGTNSIPFVPTPIVYTDMFIYDPTAYNSIDLSSFPYGYEVVDGDTFYEIDSVGNRMRGFRLAYIDAPEINHNNLDKSDRLALQAKEFLEHRLSTMQYPTILTTIDEKKDEYGRIICYIVDSTSDGTSCLNLDLIRSGLAKVAFPDSNATLIEFGNGNLKQAIENTASEAKYHLRGIYNNTEYSSLDLQHCSIDGYNTNYNKLFVHANNSNIYIIQSIVLRDEGAMTIMYKYNIDSRIWITYDLPYPLFPIDSAPDNSYEGFKLYCNNTYKASQVMSSVFKFVNNKITDDTEISFNIFPSVIMNDFADTINNLRWINVYFDTGNQSLALMNEKLFREFKLSLGTTVDKELDIDYSIKFFVDEKAVSPNIHYEGAQETYEGGYKKITFFTPARGRIPRYVFTADCRSDLNILQYAIVYLQLNAK